MGVPWPAYKCLRSVVVKLGFVENRRDRSEVGEPRLWKTEQNLHPKPYVNCLPVLRHLKNNRFLILINPPNNE